MAVVFVVTALVITENVAVLAPAGTVTLKGTVAELMFDQRVTTSPPGPARPFRMTVPVREEPPTTVVVDSETLETPAGTTPM